MDYTGPLTATMFFRVRDGAHFEDILSNPDTAHSRKAQTFLQLIQVFNEEPGIDDHYWGHQVDDESVVVFVIEWKSLQSIAAFRQTQEHQIFAAGISELFDVENAESFVVQTRFKSSPASAFEAPVTKISFFTVPAEIGERGKSLIENAMGPLFTSARTVGRSTGTSLGWVHWMKGMVPNEIPHEYVLHMVFGYASLDDHQKWSSTEGYRQVGTIMDRLSADGFTSRNIYGRSTFSVRFNRGG